MLYTDQSENTQCDLIPAKLTSASSILIFTYLLKDRLGQSNHRNVQFTHVGIKQGSGKYSASRLYARPCMSSMAATHDAFRLATHTLYTPEEVTESEHYRGPAYQRFCDGEEGGQPSTFSLPSKKCWDPAGQAALHTTTIAEGVHEVNVTRFPLPTNS